jgi:hypothetical protein
MRGAHLLLAGLAALCIVLLAAQAASPMLWTAADAAATVAERDLSVAAKMNADKAESVLPLMQDLLSQSGTIVLSVKVKDWESAQRDLERYAEMTQSMSNLVVSLDLSETDVQDFSSRSRENVEALRTLVNGTQRFEEIKELQIEYRNKDDPGKLYSIIYEGEALRDELSQAYTSYAGQKEQLTDIGRKYEADTTAYEESVDGYREIVEEVAEVQVQEVSASAPVLPPPAISIFLTPEEARYGEGVQVRGLLATGEDGAGVDLYIDSRLAASAATAESGRYEFVYTVGRNRAGTHLAYVQSGRSVSDLAQFSVLSSPSDLTLTAKANASAGLAACTGRLTALGRGVPGAEVAVFVDGNATAWGKTAENGAYQIEVPLEPGHYAIKAVFAGEGFPLEPAESQEVEVAIVDPFGLIKTVLTALAAVSFGLIAGLAYLRRSRRPAPPEPAVQPPAVVEEEQEEEEIPEPPEPTGPLSPLDEAALLWERFAVAAGRRFGIKNPRAKTPREVAAALAETPAADAAGAFARLYERVRYAGTPCGEDEVGELRTFYEAVAGG